MVEHFEALLLPFFENNLADEVIWKLQLSKKVISLIES
jgi:hypothetical protein